MDLIIQIITCVIGTLAFAITMKAPKKVLIFISIGALISASLERVLSLYTDDFLSCFIAMLTASIFCEITARKIKEPTTIILLPTTIPLLPGSAIYNTMFSLINNDTKNALAYGKSTILAGLGIALGAVISTTIFKALKHIKIKRWK